ncbi:MAG: hypothetical protein K1Y02_05130 [Candidatus Hydrogenedentes bacterium]|nr:hypothetical protein [Candidatus Hydrogenedentota bacterium]
MNLKIDGKFAALFIGFFVLMTAPNASAEELPPGSAPVVMTLTAHHNPLAQIVVSDKATPLERLAADKLVEWVATYCGARLAVRPWSEMSAELEGNFILLGTPEGLPPLKDSNSQVSGCLRDVALLGREGFAIATLQSGKAQFLAISGKTDAGVFHGAIYTRDFLLDLVPPKWDAVVREVNLVRSPALEVRGPYLLPQYGQLPLYTLDHWKHIIDRMADNGINQVHWWVAGMYPSKGYPETFTITTSKLSVADINELIAFAHQRGMRFLVGGGGFFWHGVDGFASTHPDLQAKGTSGLCPSAPGSRTFMTGYALEWLDTFPEADGLWIEPRDEGGICKCDACQKRLDSYESRVYGQAEIDYLVTLAKGAWAKNPNLSLVWLIEHLDKPGTTFPHTNDPMYFERIREIKDPRIQWMVVWEAFQLPGPRNEMKPVPFFSRNALHWDKPYWPNLQNVLDHARIAAEQGYLGYSNAWEIGFASNDWYINDVPYPVDAIPEVITALVFREACWEPGQTWDDMTGRVHRRFFTGEVPRSVAEDMLYLRQYITLANNEFRSPMDYNESHTLAAELDRISALPVGDERKVSLDNISAVIKTLESTRTEALPRMKAIKKTLSELEKTASPKSRASFELMQRAICDSIKVYNRAVPNDPALDNAIERIKVLEGPANK